MKKTTFKLTKVQLQKTIYIASILLPSLLTGNIFSSISTKQNTSTMISSLTALTSSVYNRITLSQTSFNYSLSTLLKNPAFYELDIASMSLLIAEFQYYNESISNAYIIDAAGSILYGVDDTKLKRLNNYTHIESALKGTPSYFATFINDIYFLQMSYPIFTESSQSDPSAALVLTYDFTPFHNVLEIITSSSPGLEAFLFDTNGTVITSSTTNISPYEGKTIDLNRIKLTLDLDPTSTFTLFDTTPVNGTYYNVEGDITLLVTAPQHTGIVLEDLIGFFMGILGLGGAASSQFLKSNKSSDSISDTIDNM